MDQGEVTVCDRCRERDEACQPGKQGAWACAQCHQVKASCSLVKKRPAVPSTPTKACKRPRIGEVGASKVTEVTDEAGSWGVKVCEGIATLSSNIEGLTAMIERQNTILGRLAGLMEEEADWARWRRKMEGEPVGPPAIIEGVGDEGDDEVEEEAENEGGNEEEVGDE